MLWNCEKCGNREDHIFWVKVQKVSIIKSIREVWAWHQPSLHLGYHCTKGYQCLEGNHCTMGNNQTKMLS